LPCPLEQQKRRDDSVGPIADDELICRGALDEVHGNINTCNVRNALVEKKAFAEGTLSVYRAKGATGWELEDVAERLTEMELLKPLFKVIGVPASELRAIVIEAVRVCVLDETECDHDGGHHPLHGHITPCRDHTPLDRTSDLFEKLRLGVWTHYQSASWENNLVVQVT
jgi:hypothetical protein